MSGYIRAAISVLAGIISMYILEITFPMDSIYQQFDSLIPKLYMTTSWKSVAQGTLGNWVWYDRAFVICIIALFVWMIMTIFAEHDYSRQQRY